MEILNIQGKLSNKSYQKSGINELFHGVSWEGEVQRSILEKNELDIKKFQLK